MPNPLRPALAGLPLVLCVACGGGADHPPPPQMPPAAPMAESQASFEEQRRRADEARANQAELERQRRSFVGVAFAGLDDDGRVLVSLTNESDKDIDDIRGGIWAEDGDGNVLATAGYTTAVPGDLFLKVGASVEMRPFVSPRPELAERLQKDASSVVWSFSARAITWGDGSVEPGLEP